MTRASRHAAYASMARAAARLFATVAKRELRGFLVLAPSRDAPHMQAAFTVWAESPADAARRLTAPMGAILDQQHEPDMERDRR